VNRFSGKYAIFSVAAGVLGMALAGTATAVSSDAPSYVGEHHSTAADRMAIEQLLATYTRSVTNRDEATFEKLLLNPDISFAASGIVKSAGDTSQIDTRRYAGFKAGVFHGTGRFRQTFHNIRIEQDNELAQVSLDFMNVDATSHDVSYGWKVLQLLKVHGEWKIASEFFTGYDAPTSTGAAEEKKD
jgi:hypothetical protein